jgi:hypothetical protein
MANYSVEVVGSFTMVYGDISADSIEEAHEIAQNRFEEDCEPNTPGGLMPWDDVRVEAADEAEEL